MRVGQVLILVGSIGMMAAGIGKCAKAQTAYTAPDQELWLEMSKALDDVAMSGSAHKTVEMVLQQVQRAAAQKVAAAAKAASDAKAADAAKNTTPTK